jgi:hypothetical protein
MRIRSYNHMIIKTKRVELEDHNTCYPQSCPHAETAENLHR